jgi:aminotransferase
MRERTITISGFSKTFSVTGWRVGYLACSARWAPSIGYFHDLAYVCAPSPLQRGVAAGLDELTADFYSNLAVEYLSKRDLLCSTLQQVGLHPWVPQGSYYVLADASTLPGRISKEKAMWLLKNTGVAAVPGDSFFHDDSGGNLLRFCFAKTDVELAEACRRLEKLKAAVAVG